ncbi:hypothetical protein ABZ635_05695 [Nocardiopsis sp. NPDC007018]|uniref:hypothetical protein n=1 Tax=Nocardiopsis sp. NPDC007018 TaxID=3155721 RepID=UPI003411A8BE
MDINKVLKLKKIRVVGKEGREEWRELDLRGQVRVVEALENVSERGSVDWWFNYYSLNTKPRTPEWIARLVGRAFFFEPVPGEPGKCVVAAVRKSRDPSAPPEFDILGIADAENVFSDGSGRMPAMMRRLLRTPEAWGAGASARGGVKDWVNEDFFPYRNFTTVEQAKREGGRESVLARSRHALGGRRYGGREAEAAAEALTRTIEILYSVAGDMHRMQPTVLREYFAKADKAYHALPRHHGEVLENADLVVAKARRDYVALRNQVHLLVDKLPPLGGRVKPPRPVSPRDPGFRRTAAEFANASRYWSYDMTRQLNLALGQCCPDATALEEVGVDGASVERAFEKLGGSMQKRVLSRHQDLFVPALQEAQKASPDPQGAPQRVADHLRDDRGNPSVRVPTGLLRVHTFPESGFAMVTARTLERLPGDDVSGEGARYRSVLVDVIPMRAKELGDTGPALRWAERALIADAKRQGVRLDQITDPEYCPYLVTPAVDPTTGRVWPASRRAPSPEFTVRTEEVEARRVNQQERRENLPARKEEEKRRRQLEQMAEWARPSPRDRIYLDTKKSGADHQLSGPG